MENIKSGEWVYHYEIDPKQPWKRFTWYQCSICGCGYAYRSDFCPCCGSIMKKDASIELKPFIRKHGKWIKRNRRLVCNLCSWWIDDGEISYFKFCPTCGADMQNN